MKRFFFLLAVCLLVSLSACSSGEEPVVGGDWHVWGMYEFQKIGERSVAIARVLDDQEQLIGYDIYDDGASRGPLLAEIRCEDGDIPPEEVDADAWLVFDDYNGDGLEDVGLPLKNGEVLWYAQEKNEYDETGFAFAEILPADPSALS